MAEGIGVVQSSEKEAEGRRHCSLKLIDRKSP